MLNVYIIKMKHNKFEEESLEAENKKLKETIRLQLKANKITIANNLQLKQRLEMTQTYDNTPEGIGSMIRQRFFDNVDPGEGALIIEFFFFK